MKGVRHEQHEYNTNDTTAIQVRHEWHECDINATRMTRVPHECYTNDSSATRMKNFDFDKDTSENMFSHPCISYMANEERNNFILTITFWKCLIPISKCI